MKLQSRQSSQGDKAGMVTGNRRTIRNLGIGLALIFSCLVTACQSEYKTVLDPLGPVPGAEGSIFYPKVFTSTSSSCPQGQGSLVIKTPTGLAYAGSTMYFPHLSYFIESENGWPVRCVANHSSRFEKTRRKYNCRQVVTRWSRKQIALGKSGSLWQSMAAHQQ